MYLLNAEHHQLDGSSQVSLLRHGASQRLHGHVIGASEQRLAVYCHQLVIDSQTPVLVLKKERKNKKKKRSQQVGGVLLRQVTGTRVHAWNDTSGPSVFPPSSCPLAPG